MLIHLVLSPVIWCSDLPINASVDIHDPVAYLQLASDIKASGVPNHGGMRVPLPSTFDLEYISREISGYHDQKLLDYLTFGFPLGLDPDIHIISDNNDNHAPAVRHAEAIDAYIAVEKGHGALFGPFESEPHPEFTWSPLMTHPKGVGHMVILDLSFGDFSVNKATPITDLVRFIMAKKGYTVHNYIDDIYACCHKDQAQSLIDSLIEVLQSIGLPVNSKKVHPPQSRLSIMGFIVDVNTKTFSFEREKLDKIHKQCLLAFTSRIMTRRDLQSLLGKLLYIARCVRAARIFLNRIL